MPITETLRSPSAAAFPGSSYRKFVLYLCFRSAQNPVEGPAGAHAQRVCVTWVVSLTFGSPEPILVAFTLN
jgi:hypothetical protein